jgi:hypothetical protein
MGALTHLALLKERRAALITAARHRTNRRPNISSLACDRRSCGLMSPELHTEVVFEDELVGRLKPDMFRSRQGLIALALARQEEKAAYVDEKLAGEASGNVG